MSISVLEGQLLHSEGVKDVLEEQVSNIGHSCDSVNDTGSETIII